MSNKTIRAWKDPEYRASLSADELASLPANPAGLIEISDADLGEVAGGLVIRPKPRTKAQLCPTYPATSKEKGCTVTVTFYGCLVATLY